MSLYHRLSLLIALLSSLHLSAQRSKIDSINTFLKKQAADTSVVTTLLALSDAHNASGDYPQAVKTASKALALAEKNNYSSGIFRSALAVGIILNDQGNYAEAQKYFLTCLRLSDSTGDKRQSSVAHNNIANSYCEQGDHPKSLQHFFLALKQQEELKNKDEIASIRMNIGVVYMRQGDFPKALEYYNTAEKMLEGSKDFLTLAYTIENQGIIYCQMGDLERGMKCFMSVLALHEKNGNQQGVASALNNIATTHYMSGNIQLAEPFLKSSLEIEEKLGDQQGIADAVLNLGELSAALEKYGEARSYLQKALLVARQIGSKENLKSAYGHLAKLDSTLGNFSSAFEHYKMFIVYRDSLINDENSAAIVRTEMNYEFDKQQALQKLEQEKKDAVSQQELKTQKLQRNGFIAGFSVLLLLSGVTYRSYRVKKKANIIITHQKEEVEKQKHLVEEKKQEIIDSITYAKRLQMAILPSMTRIRAALPLSFILYKPKDIVAGDFYWMEESGDYTLIAAADCTGHGVPGAMVSVVCASALNRAVKEFGLSDPGRILEKVRELVMETFDRSGSDVKDGMDISLCALNKSTGKLLWAGANNPLWIIRKGSTEVEEYKADKQPIGKMDDLRPFTTRDLQLMPGDSLYIFTDGFADQFGGSHGKKFKSANFKSLLLSVCPEEPSKQERLLDEAIEAWKGPLEQIDDICVIGLKV